MKADGGKNPQFAPVEFNVKNDEGKKPRFAHVMDNMKNDGGRKAGYAHVNPATGAENHDSPPPSYHSRDLESGNIASTSYLVRPSIRLT